MKNEKYKKSLKCKNNKEIPYFYFLYTKKDIFA